MLIVLAVLFVIAWILGFVVFHVTPFAIHVLLVVAVISLVVHFARGRRASP